MTDSPPQLRFVDPRPVRRSSYSTMVPVVIGAVVMLAGVVVLLAVAGDGGITLGLPSSELTAIRAYLDENSPNWQEARWYGVQPIDTQGWSEGDVIDMGRLKYHRQNMFGAMVVCEQLFYMVDGRVEAVSIEQSEYMIRRQWKAR